MIYDERSINRMKLCYIVKKIKRLTLTITNKQQTPKNKKETNKQIMIKKR